MNHSLTSEELNGVFCGDTDLAKECGFKVDKDTIIATTNITTKPITIALEGGAGDGVAREFDGYPEECIGGVDCIGGVADCKEEEFELNKILCDSGTISLPKLMPRYIEGIRPPKLTGSIVINCFKRYNMFNMRCKTEYKNLNLWPIGKNYVVTNYFNQNKIIVLYNGLILIDIINDKSTLTDAHFKTYVNEFHKDYLDDVKLALETFGKTAVCHDLNCYAFIPHFEKGNMILRIPILRSSPQNTRMHSQLFLENILGVLN